MLEFVDPSSIAKFFYLLVQILVNLSNLFEMMMESWIVACHLWLHRCLWTFYGLTTFCCNFKNLLNRTNTSSSSSLLESWIYTSSYVVAPSFVAIFACLLKIMFHNFPNNGLVISSISSTHLIISLISFMNHFPSSHLNDDGDAKGEFFFNDTML